MSSWCLPYPMMTSIVEGSLKLTSWNCCKIIVYNYLKLNNFVDNRINISLQAFSFTKMKITVRLSAGLSFWGSLESSGSFEGNYHCHSYPTQIFRWNSDFLFIPIWLIVIMVFCTFTLKMRSLLFMTSEIVNRCKFLRVIAWIFV